LKQFDKPEPPPPLTRVEIVPAYELPSISLPDKVTFAGEDVPLNDPDVRERLDRELHVNTFWHSNTIFLLKRGNKWLPEIERILAAEEIPSDFKYLAVIESDLTNAVSPSDAVGFWQLLEGTAKDFNLEVNKEIDERYNPLKSTEAASKYLKKAHEKFGTWTNAAASYNMGMRGLQRSVDDQGVDNYYDLLLNEETSRYVLRAVALKLIFESPSDFGFNLSQNQLYEMEDLRKVEVTETISNLRDFAFDQNINYKILKRHNPWLRQNTLTVKKGKKYTLLIPEKTN
jgi:hypothetical protein